MSRDGIKDWEHTLSNYTGIASVLGRKDRIGTRNTWYGVVSTVTNRAAAILLFVQSTSKVEGTGFHETYSSVSVPFEEITPQFQISTT